VNCSIIIRCLNEERHLPRLLDAIGRQTLRPTEVVLVDSGSTDQTVQIARSKGARVVCINPQEFSFGRALNVGARSASGDVLVLVSAHTYPCDDMWLANLLEPFSEPNIALVYGGQTGESRSKFSEVQLFHQWFPAQSCDNQTHSFCNNANAAVRRSVWQTLPYDEQIPALEDIHWAKRATERGLRIAYKAEARIVHVHEESYRQIHRRYRREGMAMRMIFPWERMTFGHACRLAASAIRSDIHEAGTAGVLGESLASIFRFRIAQYMGTWRGLRWRGTLTGDLRTRLYYPKRYHIDSGDVRAPHAKSDPAPAVPRRPE
jgi:rhamnosyltransferase